MEKISFPFSCPKCYQECANVGNKVFYCPVKSGCGFIWQLAINNDNSIVSFSLYKNGKCHYQWPSKKEYLSPFSPKTHDLIDLLDLYS